LGREVESMPPHAILNRCGQAGSGFISGLFARKFHIEKRI
jgi:hypothetical protein